MKKLTIVVLVALLAVTCERKTPTHDVTFEVRLVVDNSEILPGVITYIGIFEDLNFDLEASIWTVIFEEEMQLRNLDRMVEAKHFIRFLASEQVRISDIEQGNYFIAVVFNAHRGAHRMLFGYRRMAINNRTAREVQRFVFCWQENPEWVFIEM